MKEYNFDTREYIQGNQSKHVFAPYERLPLFVREGAILPMGKDIQSTKESQNDILLQIYTGTDGEFTLYEDEATNYNYEKGKYSTIKINYNEKTKTVTINDVQGKFEGMPTSRKFDIEWISKDGQKHPVKTVTYTGKKLSITM